MRKGEKRRYRTVFPHTIDAIRLARIQDGAYLEANDAFIKISGSSPDEIIGVHGGAQLTWHEPSKLREIQDRLSPLSLRA